MGEKGQTIIEVLVALGASVAIIAAAAIAVTSSLNNALYDKNQNLATQYAQQGMEVMRQIRDSSFSSLTSLPNGSYCLDAKQTTLSNVNSDDDTKDSYEGCVSNENHLAPVRNNLSTVSVPVPFAREVDIDNNDTTDCPQTGLNVKVIVSWTDGKCPMSIIDPSMHVYCHKVSLSSCFSNVVNTVPTP